MESANDKLVRLEFYHGQLFHECHIENCPCEFGRKYRELKNATKLTTS